MARNKYDTDEVLTTSFNIKHFARAIVYAKRHAKLIIIALISLIQLIYLKKREEVY